VLATPPAELARNAAAVLIGNELLSGKVRDANLVELARTLRARGVSLERVVMVADEVETIAREVRALSPTFDVVFTSGGLGPTHDDVTIAAVALAFGVPTVVDPALAEVLRGAYGNGCNETHLRMARVPEGARLAGATDTRWPTVVMRNVWMLPGVPEVFRMQLAVVRHCLHGPSPFVSRLVCTRCEEPDLKPLLDRVVTDHPRVEVGSYPQWFGSATKTRVTFDGRDEPSVEAAVQAFLEMLPAGAVER
jgi:molybdenum cofactor synthesis domain-containing protein